MVKLNQVKLHNSNDLNVAKEINEIGLDKIYKIITLQNEIIILYKINSLKPQDVVQLMDPSLNCSIGAIVEIEGNNIKVVNNHGIYFYTKDYYCNKLENIDFKIN